MCLRKCFISKDYNFNLIIFQSMYDLFFYCWIHLSKVSPRYAKISMTRHDIDLKEIEGC